MERAIWRKTVTNVTKDTSLDEVTKELQAIAYLGIPARKELLKIARCQRSILSNTKLRTQIKTAKSTYEAPQDL
jgi:hypothetical protein